MIEKSVSQTRAPVDIARSRPSVRGSLARKSPYRGRHAKAEEKKSLTFMGRNGGIKRMSSKHRRLIQDIALVIVLFAEMLSCRFEGYQVYVHGGAGIILAVLSVIHVIEHKRWVVALGRGKWTNKRRVSVVLVFASLFILTTALISGFITYALLDSSNFYVAYCVVKVIHRLTGVLAFLIPLAHAIYEKAKRPRKKRAYAKRKVETMPSTAGEIKPELG